MDKLLLLALKRTCVGNKRVRSHADGPHLGGMICWLAVFWALAHGGHRPEKRFLSAANGRSRRGKMLETNIIRKRASGKLNYTEGGRGRKNVELWGKGGVGDQKEHENTRDLPRGHSEFVFTAGGFYLSDSLQLSNTALRGSDDSLGIGTMKKRGS